MHRTNTIPDKEKCRTKICRRTQKTGTAAGYPAAIPVLKHLPTAGSVCIFPEMGTDLCWSVCRPYWYFKLSCFLTARVPDSHFLFRFRCCSFTPGVSFRFGCYLPDVIVFARSSLWRMRNPHRRWKRSLPQLSPYNSRFCLR